MRKLALMLFLAPLAAKAQIITKNFDVTCKVYPMGFLPGMGGYGPGATYVPGYMLYCSGLPFDGFTVTMAPNGDFVVTYDASVQGKQP